MLSDDAWLLRFFADGTAERRGDDRLLVVNLGRDLVLDPMPEPLMAPGENQVWRLLWSSEAPAYGGAGISPLDLDKKPFIPGHAAIILAPVQPDLETTLGRDDGEAIA